MAQSGYMEAEGFYKSLPECNKLALYAAFTAFSSGGYGIIIIVIITIIFLISL